LSAVIYAAGRKLASHFLDYWNSTKWMVYKRYNYVTLHYSGFLLTAIVF